MGIATEMKKLTEDIISSTEDRLIRIREIKEEAAQLQGEAQKLIKGFKTSRKQESIQHRRDLAQETARRESEVKRMLEEAERLVQGFNRSRKEEGSRMHNELAEGVAELKSEVKGILADAEKTIRSFHSKRKQMADKLRSDLAKDKATRKSEVKEMQSGFDKAQAEVKADLKKAKAAWQDLATARVKVTSKVKPPSKEKAAEVRVAEEEAPDFEAKLLEVVTEHPNGITLAEAAESLGVVPIVLGRAAKSLVERGKVRKEDKVYFPIIN